MPTWEDVSSVYRGTRAISRIYQGETQVWPVVPQTGTPTVLTIVGSSVTLCLTQSVAEAVSVDMGDGTVLTSRDLNAVFTHDFATNGTHAISITADDDATWSPGMLDAGVYYTVMGTRHTATDTKLRSVVFGEGCRTAANSTYAFANCVNLTSVNFYDSEISIVVGFSGCTSLQTIVWGSANEVIYLNAFADCSSLTGLDLPVSVETVWSGAFARCTGLENITIAAAEVQDEAFLDCTGLEMIWLRNTVRTIGNGTYGPWEGCNPDAGLYCEVASLPAGWGAAYDEYDNADDLHYTAEWGCDHAPWIVTLDWITIVDFPQDPYRVGDILDLSGVVVEALYSDGSAADVTGSCTFSPPHGTVLSTAGDVTVTATYTEGGVTETDSFIVTVEELSGIIIESAPDTVDYIPGEQLDLTGIIILASYAPSGETEDVTGLCTFSPPEGTVLSTAGTITVTVAYTEGGVTETDSFDVYVSSAGELNYSYDSSTNVLQFTEAANGTYPDWTFDDSAQQLEIGGNA